MARVSKVQPLVLKALEEKPETRADDFLLVLEVYKNFIVGASIFECVMKYHKELGLPSFASILRARRKIQEKRPDLVNAKAEEMRAREETEYRAYALNN